MCVFIYIILVYTHWYLYLNIQFLDEYNHKKIQFSGIMRTM